MSEHIPYISWSRIQAIESGEKTFLSRYLYNKRVETSAMWFGSRTTEMLERRAETDVITEAMMSVIPTYPENNVRLAVNHTIDGKEVPVLGYLDGLSPDTDTIGEYKTGKTKWGERKAKNHGQCKMYSWIFNRIHNKIPTISLTWLETVKDEKDIISLTGQSLTHSWKYTQEELDEFQLRIESAYRKMILAIDTEILKIAGIDIPV